MLQKLISKYPQTNVDPLEHAGLPDYCTAVLPGVWFLPYFSILCINLVLLHLER